MTWEITANALQGIYQTEEGRAKLLMLSQKERFMDSSDTVLLLTPLLACVNEIF